jgi:hypothetical protein
MSKKKYWFKKVRHIRFLGCSKFRTYLKKFPINGIYYIHTTDPNYKRLAQRIDSEHVIERRGRFFLYGWWEIMPQFRAIPVNRIMLLVDQQTGEVVRKEEVLEWLLGRAKR